MPSNNPPTTGYVVNPSSGVVHTETCNWGPLHPRTVGGYMPLPAVLLDYLPTKLLCRHCLSALLNAKSAA